MIALKRVLRKLGFSADFRGVSDSRTDVRWQYRLVGRHLTRLGFRLIRVANRLRVGREGSWADPPESREGYICSDCGFPLDDPRHADSLHAKESPDTDWGMPA